MTTLTSGSVFKAVPLPRAVLAAEILLAALLLAALLLAALLSFFGGTSSEGPGSPAFLNSDKPNCSFPF